MSDFLIRLGKRYNGKDLLNLIRSPYGDLAPRGQFFNFPWGSMAVLEERLACNKNVIAKDASIFAWVGDLVMDFPDGFAELFINRISRLQECGNNEDVSLETDTIFEKLNGTFAIVLANPAGFSIVTDPLSFIPVYIGKNERGDIVSVGTRADLVAAVSSGLFIVDPVSVAEFLNSGTYTFPNTIYANVRQMKPGRVYNINIIEKSEVVICDFIYWLPPKELHEGYNEQELAEELKKLFLAAVRDRCKTQKVAVLLSGGLDSRVVAAAVPRGTTCVCMTYCDYLNRETRTAKRIAECYGHDWIPLVRDKEFLGNSIFPVAKLAGCEAQWFDAHTVKFVEEITKHHVNVILTGWLFNNYLKALYTYDIVRVKRMGGILPAAYRKIPYDYAGNVGSLWKQHLKEDIVERLYNRRKEYYEDNFDSNRGSIESLIIYPFSQNLCAFWPADRRVLPIRLVMADRRLLDFAFKCPVQLKMDNKIVLLAGREAYGRGAAVPCANDGVRPRSGHWSRLLQRALRNIEHRTIQALEKLGREPRVQHSYSDYQKYWQESRVIAQLSQRYGGNLGQFDGWVFAGCSRDLLKRKDVDWRDGFRLLQLAIWAEVIKDYRDKRDEFVGSQISYGIGGALLRN